MTSMHVRFKDVVLPGLEVNISKRGCREHLRFFQRKLVARISTYFVGERVD